MFCFWHGGWWFQNSFCDIFWHFHSLLQSASCSVKLLVNLLILFFLLEKTLPKPSQERKSRKSSERKLRKSSSDKELTWVYRTVTEKSGKHQTGAGIGSEFGDITDIDEESREDSNNDYNKYSLFNTAQTLYLEQRFVVIFLQAIFALHLQIITVWFDYPLSLFLYMRSLPEEPHLAWVGVTFSDFRHVSWANFLCKWAKILICWWLTLLQ